MRFLLMGAALMGLGLLADGAAVPPSWDELLRGFVSQLLPLLLGAGIHWIGVHLGGKAARDATPAAPTSAADSP